MLKKETDVSVCLSLRVIITVTVGVGELRCSHCWINSDIYVNEGLRLLCLVVGSIFLAVDFVDCDQDAVVVRFNMFWTFILNLVFNLRKNAWSLLKTFLKAKFSRYFAFSNVPSLPVLNFTIETLDRKAMNLPNNKQKHVFKSMNLFISHLELLASLFWVMFWRSSSSWWTVF